MNMLLLKQKEIWAFKLK